tara:strand:+ start:153 stop:461 length:309 start_codon:yes stop_codon:yes gene_type:complete
MSKNNAGLTKKQAKNTERAIVIFSIIALICLFQPFTIYLYGLACAGVVIAGLMFNLVPLCVEGVKTGQLIKIAIIIFVILVIVAVVAVGAGHLYGWYLVSTR